MTYNRNEDVSDEFDEYDPTPYGGGYDITVTYGRPLEPSEETCYPISSKSGDIDYDRPSYTSCSEPSAYGDEALENEYKSYARPKPRPVLGYAGPPPGQGGFGGSGDGGEYGYQPKPPSSFGGEGEYGSGHGRKPDYEEPSSEYGSGYGRKPECEQPSSEYGSGYGRKPEYEQPSTEYGSGYGRKPEYEQPSSEYGSGYGRRPEFEQPSSEYGSGYGRRPEYEAPSSEYGSGYGRKPSFGEEQGGGYGYGGEGSPRKPQYGRPSYESPEVEEPPRRPSYGRPSNEWQEEEGYEKPAYERRDDDDDEPRKYGYGEEGYGRKKYVSTLMLSSL